jgi:nitroimidazol reductase NimA-like FMN-containing flavoprotein (pyridoxamine 5'-phosphate oxidase superfamily)
MSTSTRSTRSDPVVELESAECWRLLRREADGGVGRLAVAISDHPDIFPINFVVDGHTIVFRTGPGTKLAASVLGRGVAFEIDGYEAAEGEAWSVVVKGRATQIEHMLEYFEAESLPLFPWHTGPKPDFVRIEPEIVTGRRFHVVDERSPSTTPTGEKPYMSPD